MCLLRQSDYSHRDKDIIRWHKKTQLLVTANCFVSLCHVVTNFHNFFLPEIQN